LRCASALPLTGGYSFANVTRTQKVSDISQMDRYVVLDLVAQHLSTIEMYRTTEILARESEHVFQRSDQPWDRTDLHLLVSLAVAIARTRGVCLSTSTTTPSRRRSTRICSPRHIGKIR
jgi:hypothetical protein